MKQIIYIASPNSQEIHVWKLSQNKKLQSIQILTTSGQVQPMVIHPQKNILYVGMRPDPKIISFRIEKNGCLKKMQEFSIPAYSTHLNINKTGTILYSVSYKNNSLSICKLDYSGHCISILQILTNLPGCHSSNLEMTKQRLWVPCLKEDCVRIYNIDISGKLNENSLLKINTQLHSGPRHMVFHHSYNYAYLINELNSTVTVIATHMSLDHIPVIIETVSMIPKNYNYHNNIHHHCWASDIHITPDSHWIYCSDRSNSIISYLRILDHGKKLQLKGCHSTEMQPRGFAIDDQGRYLIAAGQKSNFISIYKINKQNGILTQLFRFLSGEGPVWITIINLNNN